MLPHNFPSKQQKHRLKKTKSSNLSTPHFFLAKTGKNKTPSASGADADGVWATKNAKRILVLVGQVRADLIHVVLEIILHGGPSALIQDRKSVV